MDSAHNHSLLWVGSYSVTEGDDCIEVAAWTPFVAHAGDFTPDSNQTGS